jgi:hypothetical protein
LSIFIARAWLLALQNLLSIVKAIFLFILYLSKVVFYTKYFYLAELFKLLKFLESAHLEMNMHNNLLLNVLIHLPFKDELWIL